MYLKQTVSIIVVLALFQKICEGVILTQVNTQSCFTTEKEITSLQDIKDVIGELKKLAGFIFRQPPDEVVALDKIHLRIVFSAKQAILELIEVYSDTECILKDQLITLWDKLKILRKKYSVRNADDLVIQIEVLQLTVSKIIEIKDESRASDIMKSIKYNRTTYISHDEMTDILKDLVEEYPSQMSMYSIGKSGQGREIWVVTVSGDKPDEHVLLRPEIKYVGGIHGNEPVGGQVLIRFLAYLGQNYGKDETITALMNSSRMHVLPMLNPDGFMKAYKQKPAGGSSERICAGNKGRNTVKNSVDMNRNFGPEYFKKTYNPDPVPETLAVKRWLEDFPFVMSLSFHGGAMVAAYPYDNKRLTREERKDKDVFGSYSESPDDDIFRQMALTYSYSHGRMYAGALHLNCDWNFTDGISNGADWFYVRGGMQDYNYVNFGVMAITIEMECCKYPDYSKMDDFWHENLPSFMNSWKHIHRGIKGIISDSRGNPVPDARVYIDGRKHPFKSTTQGEYWRILLPGTYNIRVRTFGYKSYRQQIVVNEPELSGATIVNITLVDS